MIFKKPEGKESLNDEAYNLILILKREFERAEWVSIDILHSDIVVVTLPIRVVVSNYIGMIEAF
jgi:hypothetical protein